MAGAKGLEDCTWDSASSAFLRFGSTKVPLTKCTPPKEDVKTEKIRPIGAMRATKRTPGVSDIADASAEILLTEYTTLILPRLPRHGGTLVEFVVTLSVFHPSVKGSYGMLWDACRFVAHEGPELDGSEKGLIKKLGISILDVWEKGEDGIWKTQSLKPLPSSQAIPLLQF